MLRRLLFCVALASLVGWVPAMATAPTASPAWANPNPAHATPPPLQHPRVLQPGRVLVQVGEVPGLVARPAMAPASQWVPLADVQLVLHEQNQRLADLVNLALQKAQTYSGPWQVEWRLQKTNLDLMDEPLSLSAETTFGDFINRVADFVQNERGITLAFNLFNTERLLVITDAPR